VAPVLEGLKACVIEHRPPDLGWTSWSVAVALGLAWAGPAAFQRLEPRFAESV
jgi:ABC-type polysaccharide/polyol phosphate export permease